MKTSDEGGERTHLEIACAAAVAAGLAPDEVWARRHIETIIAEHANELRTAWQREPGGGQKGWVYLLRTFGFEERLVVRRVAKGGKREKRGEMVKSRVFAA